MSERFDPAFWDERYLSRAALWSAEPNGNLVSEVVDLKPGTALDVGSGEGADAIWLADHGWRVSALDLSAVALQRGAANAERSLGRVAERIEWRHVDLIDWQPGEEKYDLISAQYFHLPAQQRVLVFDRLAGAVAPGGTLLIVGHHPSDLHTTMPRPNQPELFFSGDELAAALSPAQWQIVTNAVRGRSVTDPHGRAVTISDTVFRAGRRRL